MRLDVNARVVGGQVWVRLSGNQRTSKADTAPSGCFEFETLPVERGRLRNRCRRKRHSMPKQASRQASCQRLRSPYEEGQTKCAEIVNDGAVGRVAAAGHGNRGGCLRLEAVGVRHAAAHRAVRRSGAGQGPRVAEEQVRGRSTVQAGRHSEEACEHRVERAAVEGALPVPPKQVPVRQSLSKVKPDVAAGVVPARVQCSCTHPCR